MKILFFSLCLLFSISACAPHDNKPNSSSDLNYITKLITDQIKMCWSPPAKTGDPKNSIIAVDVDLEANGKMEFIGFVDDGNFGHDPDMQASVKRAILDPSCNPLHKLPPADKYESAWKQMRFIFNPKEMLN